MLIGNEEVPSVSGLWTDVTNPATGELVGRAPTANPEDVARAVESAHEGFREWAAMTPFERAELMQAAAQRMRDEVERLARLGVAEEGKPLNQYEGEIRATANMLEYYAAEGIRVHGEILPAMHKEREVFVLREPVGVVACIVPWNFPVFLMARGMTAALGAGCSVVVKPASATPLASIEVVKIFRDVGFPPGTVNIITGSGATAGEALVTHPLTAKVCFTGGVEAGRRVMALAAPGIKGSVMELGGQCPAIVTRSANLSIAVDAIIGQGYKNTGEVCNRVNRVYVERDVEEEFYDRFGAKVARITVGNGLENPDMGPLISDEHLAKVEGHVRDAVSKGARVLAGGERLRGGIYDGGAFFPATALSDCTHDMLVMTEETMGPVIGAMTVDSFEEALELANRTDYGLSSFLFASDMNTAMRGMHELKAGAIYINDIHNLYLHCPYGGMKQSGLGRDFGRAGIEEYLEYKTVYFDWARHNRGGYVCVHDE